MARRKIDPEVGRATQFSKNRQPEMNKKRKTMALQKRIRAQLKHLLEQDGELKLDFDSITSIGGVKRYKLKKLLADYLEIEQEKIDAFFDKHGIELRIPKAEEIALRWYYMTMSSNQKISFDAMKEMTNQIEGKPTQVHDFPKYFKIGYKDEDEE